MAESTIYSHFCFKSCRVQDLKDSRADGPVRVQVAKIIQLTQEQYQHFCSHLLEDMSFIKANNRLKGSKDVYKRQDFNYAYHKNAKKKKNRGERT